MSKQFKLTTFMAEVIRHRQWAKKYNFTISWASPEQLRKWNGQYAQLSKSAHPTENLFMRCESMVFPGQNISTSPDDIRIGPSREHAHSVTYAPVQATFLCSPDLREKVYFQEWQDLIIDRPSFRPTYYNKYVTDMNITQFNDKGEATYKVKLIDAFPKGIMAQEVAIADGEFIRLSVEIAYYRWAHVGVDAAGSELPYTQVVPAGDAIPGGTRQSTPLPSGDAPPGGFTFVTPLPDGDAIPGGTRQSTPLPAGDAPPGGFTYSTSLPAGDATPGGTRDSTALPPGFKHDVAGTRVSTTLPPGDAPPGGSRDSTPLPPGFKHDVAGIRVATKLPPGDAPPGIINYPDVPKGDAPPGGTRKSTPVPGSSTLNELFT